MHQNCPICFEFLFESVDPTTVLRCGHTIHTQCVRVRAQGWERAAAGAGAALDPGAGAAGGGGAPRARLGAPVTAVARMPARHCCRAHACSLLPSCSLWRPPPYLVPHAPTLHFPRFPHPHSVQELEANPNAVCPTCPICKKALGDYSAHWRELDRQVGGPVLAGACWCLAWLWGWVSQAQGWATARRTDGSWTAR